MCGPAGHTGDGEERCDELIRDVQHVIDKAAVEVDVWRYGLEHFPFLPHQIRCQTGYCLMQVELIHTLFLLGQLLSVVLQDLGPGIGLGINGMSDTVDQTGLVEGLLPKDLQKIGRDLIIILPVLDLLLHLVKHLLCLDVGTAVLGSLQGAERCSHGGVGIRAGGGDYVGRKGGIVSAAVLSVEHQGDIQKLRLQRRELLMLTHDAEQVFCCGQLRLRIMDVKPPVLHVVTVGQIGVSGDQRYICDQLDGLTQNVGYGQIVRLRVVGIQGQDGTGHGIHDVLVG